jgi:hypothetical protein
VEIVKIVPTWRNARRGREGISKRLDRFLIFDNTMEDISKIKSWVGYGVSSDQLPLFYKLSLKILLGTLPP